MGLLGNLFGNKSVKEEGNGIPWIPLVEMQQLNAIQEKSKDKPQAIFKHSTTCGISRMVIKMFENSFDVDVDQMDLYFLDLHAHRQISNEVASTFEVMHQSPQLLIIKNGATIFHTSHGAISDVSLKDFI